MYSEQRLREIAALHLYRPSFSSLPTRPVLAGQILPWKVRNSFLCWLGSHCGIPSLPLHWSQGTACSIPAPSQLNREGSGKRGEKKGLYFRFSVPYGCRYGRVTQWSLRLPAAFSLSCGSRLSLSLPVSGWDWANTKATGNLCGGTGTRSALEGLCPAKGKVQRCPRSGSELGKETMGMAHGRTALGVRGGGSPPGGTGWG